MYRRIVNFILIIVYFFPKHVLYFVYRNMFDQFVHVFDDFQKYNIEFQNMKC